MKGLLATINEPTPPISMEDINIFFKELHNAPFKIPTLEDRLGTYGAKIIREKFLPLIDEMIKTDEKIGIMFLGAILGVPVYECLQNKSPN